MANIEQPLEQEESRFLEEEEEKESLVGKTWFKETAKSLFVLANIVAAGLVFGQLLRSNKHIGFRCRTIDDPCSLLFGN